MTRRSLLAALLASPLGVLCPWFKKKREVKSHFFMDGPEIRFEAWLLEDDRLRIVVNGVEASVSRSHPIAREHWQQFPDEGIHKGIWWDPSRYFAYSHYVRADLGDRCLKAKVFTDKRAIHLDTFTIHKHQPNSSSSSPSSSSS